MNNIKIKCPAKINLTLEVLNKRDDGYHNIRSIMQLISLYDYLNITIEHADSNRIILTGDCDKIPYDSSNLVYKAAELYLKEACIENILIRIDIEKNIPVAAGLAGGSTDAAGTLYGLNKIFEAYNDTELQNLCAKLGSDLNVCLKGGCNLASSRGEVISSLPCTESEITLIKPERLGISAGFAYKKYSQNPIQHSANMTEKMIEAINKGFIDKNYLYNDLEHAVFNDYKELQVIKKMLPDSIMTGSGSTYFVLENIENSPFNDDYTFINNLHFIKSGVSVA